MNRTYAEAAITLTLGIITAVTGYFVGFKVPTALFMLLPICATFGFSAYISREGFNKASLAALPILGFAALGGPIALYAGATAIGAVLVSFFAGGERFRSYYGSTSVPLALIGVGLSAAVFLTVMGSPSLQDDIRNSTADLVGNEVEKVINDSDVISSQKEQYSSVVGSTANTTILYTKAYVLNETRNDLSRQDLQAVNSAFEEARVEVSSEIANKTESTDTSIDISGRVADVIKGQLTGKRFLILIPFILSSVMLMQPVVGLLTAIFAKVYAAAESKLV